MAQATTDDTDQTRLAHIKCMLAHLEQQEREAAPQGAPADVATELSAMMDLYLGVSRLDRRAHCRMRGSPGHVVYGDINLRFTPGVGDLSDTSLTLKHGVSLSYGNLAISTDHGGVITLDGASTLANGSTFSIVGGKNFSAPVVLNGSMTVQNGSMADFRQAAPLEGHGTVNVGAGDQGAATVSMNAVLAGLHVNVANRSHLILRAANPGGEISFHGTINEAAGATVFDFGAAATAVREIFHKATGTLDLINKAGTQVAELQFAKGSREYTSIIPGSQYATITTSPIAGTGAHTIPTIFVH